MDQWLKCGVRRELNFHLSPTSLVSPSPSTSMFSLSTSSQLTVQNSMKSTPECSILMDKLKFKKYPIPRPSPSGFRLRDRPSPTETLHLLLTTLNTITSTTVTYEFDHSYLSCCDYCQLHHLAHAKWGGGHSREPWPISPPPQYKRHSAYTHGEFGVVLDASHLRHHATVQRKLGG